MQPVISSVIVQNATRGLKQITLCLMILLFSACSDPKDQSPKSELNSQPSTDQTKEHLLQTQQDALDKAKDTANKLEQTLEQRKPK